MQTTSAAKYVHVAPNDAQPAEKEVDSLPPRSIPKPRAGLTSGRPVCILDFDDELATCVPAADQHAARQAACARTLIVSGTHPVTLPAPDPGALGCLVTEGHLVRRVRVADCCSVELIGPGDVVSPWLEDQVSFSRGQIEPLEPARIALLDQHFAASIAPWPRLHAALFERALRRSRCLAIVDAIGHMVGLERRLTTLFWYLAERWGKRADGAVCVNLPLTHQLIADMVGARRPPVTTALAKLARAGSLQRDGTMWRLRCEPPDLD